MDLSGLSLDQAPPYNTVQRFFFTAPVFLLLTGVVLLVLPGYPFFSIINHDLIGITHLVTLGFMTMTMFGAFFQMLPVVAGVKITNPRMVSTVVYFLLLAGILLLSGGYLFSAGQVLPYAAGLLFSAVVFFVSRIIFKLFAVKNPSPTIHAMRLSLLSLLVLMSIGVTMIAWKLGFIPPVEVNLLPVHISWAVFGWVMLLIMGVSFQVIPMFYVAPEYPVFFKKYNTYLIFGLLIINSLVVFIFNDRYGLILSGLRIIVYSLSGAYAAVTIRVINSRRRKLPDPSLLFWKTSMVFLLLAMGLAGSLEFYNGKFSAKLTMLTGMFLLVGFVVSLIIGMMYKIVPFLSWFHLASKGIFDAPTMKDMLPDNRIIVHYFTYLVFLASTLSVMFLPRLASKIIGGALVGTALFLWINLVTVMGKYAVISRKSRAKE